VVVHSPRHVRTFAELRDDEVDRVAEAWQTRRRAEPGGYLHALVNEGRAAGASLLHSHSQLVWLPGEPPAVAAERHDGCTLCEVAAQNVVREAEGVRVSCPYASRVPYELLVAPVAHEEEAFESARLGHALRLTRDVIADVRVLEGPFPWNAWLHNGRHWHLEVFPRLTVLAGIELGAGIYVNTLAPEDAAATLRAEGA
jgi:UDPglucose--hexose-1-phosphate uridylyltransferase